VSQSKLDVNARSRHKAREKACERVTIGFGFTSDWLTKWHVFFKPIAWGGNAKPKQMLITFATQVKTARHNL